MLLVLLAICLCLLPLVGAVYVSSKAQSGQGTLIQINPTLASPSVWVTVGEPLSIMFGDKNIFDDTTNLQSTAKEFLAILPDPGILQVDLNRFSGDAGQVAVRNSYANLTRVPWQVVMPLAPGQSVSGDVYSFLAYVEQLTPDVKVDKKVTAKFSLRVTGAITFTLGS